MQTLKTKLVIETPSSAQMPFDYYNEASDFIVAAELPSKEHIVQVLFNRETFLKFLEDLNKHNKIKVKYNVLSTFYSLALMEFEFEFNFPVDATHVANNCLYKIENGEVTMWSVGAGCWIKVTIPINDVPNFLPFAIFDYAVSILRSRGFIEFPGS